MNNTIFENKEGKQIYSSIIRALDKYVNRGVETIYGDATDENVSSDNANFFITTYDRDVIKGFSFRSSQDKCTLVVDLKRNYDPEENASIISKIKRILYSGKYPNWRLEI